MSAQITTSLFMVRPANFGFNTETSSNNFYQKTDERPPDIINSIARSEFNGFVELLKQNKLKVLDVEDNAEPKKTDAVFPNNWFSTHEDGQVILYPMFSSNRRLERRNDLIDLLVKSGFKVGEIIDLTFFEQYGQYLEGTGSLVLDRQHKIAYACRSVRSHPVPLQYFADLMGYDLVDFNATQVIMGKSTAIYHTNVMMHVGSEISVVCLDCVAKNSDKMRLQESLEKSGKKIIPITAKQKFNFAGNMLEVLNSDNQKFTVMSDSAFQSLNRAQIQVIEKYTNIIVPKISTIEKIGGGSARCMIAEIFLPSMATA